jgi:hypothetical protein
MSAAARGIWTAGVVTLCALPSAALNVWPKVPQLLSGTAAGSDVAFVVIVVTAVLLMAAVPFAAKKASNLGWKALFWTFGLALATLNYSLAVASVGKLRDLDAGPLRELVHKAAALDSRIERAKNSRKQLPQAPPAVDQKMLDAADQSVTLADEARRQECGRIGENCRLRVAELKEATDRRAPLLAQKVVADQIARLETEIRDLERERQNLGPIPENVDAQAVRLSKQLGSVVDLGANPVEATADILISGMSIFAELIGLLGPVIFMTAMSPGSEDRPARSRWWPWRRQIEPDVSTKIAVADTTAAPKPAAPAPSPAIPAPKKKANKIKAAGVRELSSVREWKESRTAARSGSKVKPGDAYAAYKDWCVENGKGPVSLTAFGTIMKGELGVLYEEKNKRGFYLDIALVGAPKLVASAIDNAPSRRALGSMVSHN